MGKILEAFRKFKHDVHEMDNAEKLKTMLPRTTVYDMGHIFAHRTHNGAPASIFDKALEKQPYVYHTAFNSAEYTTENARNQVLFHGIMFKELFDVYTTYLKKPFDNCLLSPLFIDIKQNQDKRFLIDFIQYKQLPKRFRGIFVKYDEDNYILNIPNPVMTITYNKKDRQKLEKLLLRAKMLIPVIYKDVSSIIWDDEPDAEDHNLWTGTKVRTPAFVKNSPSAKCVSDEQLATIRELHNIFIEIAKITLPVATKQKENSGALEILEELNKECYQREIFVRAQDEAKNLKADHDEIIKKSYKTFKKRKKQLKTNYREFRSDLLAMLAKETGVNIK